MYFDSNNQLHRYKYFFNTGEQHHRGCNQCCWNFLTGKCNLRNCSSTTSTATSSKPNRECVTFGFAICEPKCYSLCKSKRKCEPECHTLTKYQPEPGCECCSECVAFCKCIAIGERVCCRKRQPFSFCE